MVWLNSIFAQEMCDMIKKETSYDVIMVGQDGKIFAASSQNRIGHFHSVAKNVIDGIIPEGVVTVEDAQENPSLKAGISSPVKYNNETILVLGITGNPEYVRPIIGITRQNIIMHIQSEERVSFLKDRVENVDQELLQISSIIQQISGVAQEIATESEITLNKSKESYEKLDKMSEILEMIKSIASRTNIIGINAAIEAARVGEAGRGFSVVAKEVQNLANSSNKSVLTIGEILADMGKNIEEVLFRVKDNNDIQQEQTTTIQSISKSIIAIEETMREIVEKMEQ